MPPTPEQRLSSLVAGASDIVYGVVARSGASAACSRTSSALSSLSVGTRIGLILRSSAPCSASGGPGSLIALAGGSIDLGSAATAAVLVHADGHVSQRVRVVGPLTRGRFFEIEAVPDIRIQCQTVATSLLAS